MKRVHDRARSFLLYGFAISLAVHALVLPFVHRENAVSADEPLPDRFRIDEMPTPPPSPKPTPTPKPTAVPTPPPRASTRPPVAQPRIRIVTPRFVTHRGAGSEPGNTHTSGDRDATPDAVATGAPSSGDATPDIVPATATPAPRPTPTAVSCARPNVPATTLRALEPETPAIAAQQGISGIVSVVVSLDAQSRVVNARVAGSPSAVLNAPALAAARGSQFRTEVKNCQPVAADYLFSVEFSAQ